MTADGITTPGWQRVALACCAVLVAAAPACSNTDDPKPARMGDRYPENLAFVRERCGRVGYSQLRPREQVVYCLGGFEAEMSNGGFDQFFRSSAGDYTGATLEALEAIGATKVKALLQKAIVLGFEGFMVPIDRAERLQQLKRPSLADEQELADRLATLGGYYDDAAQTLTDLANSWLTRSK